MAATNNLIGYSTTSQVTCTLTSLATGSTRESATVSNATNKYFDYLVSLTFTIASGSPSTSSPVVNLYAGGSVDGTLWPIIQKSDGTTYATGGGDAAVGALSTGGPNVNLLGSFGLLSTTSAGERTFRTQPFSVAQVFGGEVPEAFSLFVENQSGVAFSSSATTSASYVEVVGVYSSSGN